MAQKFSITPQTITLGTITLSFGYDQNDVSNVIVLASATGAQATQQSAVIERNGTNLNKAIGAATATDQQNVGLSLRDALLTPGA